MRSAVLAVLAVALIGCSPIVPKPDDSWLGDAFNHTIKEQKHGR